MLTRFWNEMAGGTGKGPIFFLARLLLLPFSFVYGIAAAARNVFYNAGLLRARRLPVPVISVGNIVVGGTGKSPLVQLIARGLSERGTRVAVLSRGYGAAVKDASLPVVVSDGERVMHDAARAGDEPLMLARRLPGSLILADPDRLRAGAAAAGRLGAEIIILDDGFQHRRAARDVDILLLDAARPFGNGLLLPAGPMRETAGAIARADIIILTRCEGEPARDLLARVRRLNPGAAVFRSRHEPVLLRRIPSGEIEKPGFLKGIRVAAFSGIARPDDFIGLLTRLGARCVCRRDFPDHHYYSEAETGAIVAAARRAGAEAIVTTAKDAVRLPGTADRTLPLLALEIKMTIGDGEEKLIESVLNKISNKERNFI